jgi:ATP-dependent RNA helicase SUPV3L1/SUV3
VPLDRKQEQKLWEAFRKPIDEAFERKTQPSAKGQAQALSEHDQRVLDAAQGARRRHASGDAQQIRAAMAALEAACAARPRRGCAASAAPCRVGPPEAGSGAEGSRPRPSARRCEAPPRAQAAPRKKLVAMRGDDRPGMQRAAAGRRRPPGRDGPPPMARGAVATAGAARAAGRGGRDDRAPARPAPGRRRLPRPAPGPGARQPRLRKLAAQAHGEVLTQLLDAWAARCRQACPRPGAGVAASAAARGLGAGASAQAAAADAAPKPAAAGDGGRGAHAGRAAQRAPRMLQLQLLTRRHEPRPPRPGRRTWRGAGLGPRRRSARRLQACSRCCCSSALAAPAGR